MKTYGDLLKSGRAIAAQFGVSKLFATADDNHFISEHDARSHGKAKGLKVHELDYTDGGGSSAASKPAGAGAGAVTSAPATDAQPSGAEQKSYLSKVLAAIGQATDAKELSAAVPPAMMSNPFVMEALASRRTAILKSINDPRNKPEPQVSGDEGQVTSEKKEDAPAETKAAEGTPVAETRTPAELLETVSGIGRATAIKLVAAGVNTVAELAASDAATLAAKSGVNKALLARAIDGLNK